MRRLVAALTVLVLLGVVPPAHAEDTDVVVLTSGNRMTGRIRELSRGELTFVIEGARPIDINARNIAQLASTRTFDIELGSGERLTGTISATLPGKLAVRGAGGLRTVEMKDVIRITWIGASIRERTSASLALGFDFLSAGDAVDWTFDGEVEHRTRYYLTEASLDSLVRKQNHETTQRRTDFEIATRRFLPDRWFVLGRFEARDDQELGLDSRLLAGGAVGATLVQSNRTVLALYGGLDYMLEDYSGIRGTDGSVEALGALEWDWFEIGADTELDTRATVYRSFDRSRARVEFDGSLRRNIFRNFFWSLNLFESYDSDPPPGFEHSDFGLTLAVGLALRRL